MVHYFLNIIVFFGKFIVLPLLGTIVLFVLLAQANIIDSANALLYIGIFLALLAIVLSLYKKTHMEQTNTAEQQNTTNNSTHNRQIVVVKNSVWQIALGVFTGILMWTIFCFLIGIIFFSAIISAFI